MNILTIKITINAEKSFEIQAFETERYLSDLMTWLKSSDRIQNISSINLEVISRQPPSFMKEIMEFSVLDREFLIYQLSDHNSTYKYITS